MLLLTNCVRSIRQNIPTADLKYGPNEISSVRAQLYSHDEIHVEFSECYRKLLEKFSGKNMECLIKAIH